MPTPTSVPIRSARRIVVHVPAQEGTANEDKFFAGATLGDGSLFLAGETGGDWGSTNAGTLDFALAKLHPNGTTAWRWQVRQTESLCTRPPTFLLRS